MHTIHRMAVAAALVLATALVAQAQHPPAGPTDTLMTPVGTWKTIDDKTGEAKSLVQISEVNGQLEGKVVKVLKSDQGPNPICDQCDGARHNQPVTGMTILWGMKQDGNEWDGGQILDPKSGKIYKCSMHAIDGGKKLSVRGYIGFSLFGRSQTWLREE